MSEYTPKHSCDETPENKKQNKIVYYIIMGAALLVLVASLIYLGIYFFFSGKETSDEFKNSSPATPTVSVDLPQNPIDFEKLQAQYPDAFAWIQMPGIEQIDYPIFMSQPEADDNYYLDHNRDGEEDRYGEIYVQKLNYKDFSDPNTLIYGHNMSNGDMFGKLYDGNGKQFDNKEFFEQHRTIYIYTPGHILEYEIISAFVYDNRHILNSFNFDVEQEREEFFNQCTNPTSFTKQVLEDAELNYMEDKIITLSTCTGDDATRYLVVGRLVSDTETA